MFLCFNNKQLAGVPANERKHLKHENMGHNCVSRGCAVSECIRHESTSYECGIDECVNCECLTDGLFKKEQGQASIEAAFLLPIFFLIFGLFLQPVFLLYNRCVMHAAAAESCRMLASATTDENSKKAYVFRRLSAIPCISPFHEGDAKNYEVSFSGGQMSEEVSVKIINHAKPLPLFGITAGLTEQMDGSSIRQEVSVSTHVIPAWAANAGSNPSDWISKWK